MNKIQMTLRELETLFSVDVIAVQIDDRAQGVHLAPGERFEIPVKLIIQGRKRR